MRRRILLLFTSWLTIVINKLMEGECEYLTDMCDNLSELHDRPFDHESFSNR